MVNYTQIYKLNPNAQVKYIHTKQLHKVTNTPKTAVPSLCSRTLLICHENEVVPTTHFPHTPP